MHFVLAFADFADTLGLREELLFVFPIINLVSSPSKSVKQAAIDLLSTMKKLSVSLPVARKKELIVQGKFPPVSRAGDIIFRLLQHLWFQVQYPFSGRIISSLFTHQISLLL